MIFRAVCVAVLALLAGSRSAAALDADEVRVRIIAINDFHGHLEPGDLALSIADPLDPSRTVALRSGGAAFLATRIARLRRESPHHVVVSAGDLIGASPLISALFRDEPTIEVMNLIGLDLNAAGNHEFDRGVDELRRLVDGGCAPAALSELATCAHPGGRYAGARFPFLAANVIDNAGRSLFAASIVRQFDGVHVGFVAAVTRSTPGSVMPAGIRGWRFGREVEAINRAVDALVARGVHAVVAVVHEGGETDGGWNDCERPRGAIFDIARRLHPAVALVLSAHTHRAYRCTLDGRLIVQAASYGRLVSVVDLALDRRGGTVIVERSAAVNVPVPNDRNDSPSVRAAYPPLAADAEVARLVAHYAERAAPLALRPAGRIAATFERRAAEGADSAAGRLVADAHLAATRAQGARIAFTNPGGIRSDLIARTGADTEVTFGDLFMMQPFGNHLVTMTLSGAQIRALLEDQWSRSHTRRVRLLQPSRGFTYAWRAGAPEGQRIVADSLILDGEAIEPDRPYRVTVNGYLAAGGDAFGILRTGRDRVSGPLDVEALMGFIRRESRRAPLAPDPVPRIRRID